MIHSPKLPLPNDDFWPCVGHQLRNPLSTILAQAEALTAGIFGPLTPEQGRAAQSIQENVRSMFTMIHDLVDVAGERIATAPAEPERCDIATMFRDAFDGLGAPSRLRSIQLIDASEEQDVIVMADSARLQRTITELVGLLVATVPVRSTVRVSALCRRDKLRIEVRRCTEGNVEQSESLDELSAGTSPLLVPIQKLSPLGCAVLSGLVTSFGGEWLVRSCGNGSVAFILHLPLAPALTASLGPMIKAPDRVDSKVDPSSISILLADDQPDIVAVASHYLESLGYQITIAHDGEAAIEFANRLQPDLILMDVQMPVMDGLTATKRIRAASPKLGTVPIICLTGMTTEIDKARCMEAGATACLSKPFGIAEINLVLATHLNTHAE